MKQLNIWKTSFYTMLAIAAGAFTACVDDDVDKQAPTLELSEEAVAFTGTATEDATVTVRSNRQWTVAYEDEETQKEWMYFKVSGNEVSEGIYNGDGTVKNPGDMRVIGNSLPRYTYSIRGDLNWNGFDFAVFFQGVCKRDWYPAGESGLFWGQYDRPYGYSLPWQNADRWSEDNPNAYWPRLRGSLAVSGRGTLRAANDRYLQKARYCRLKNISLGYTLPQQITRKAHIEKLRIYVSGENLFFWSPLKKYAKNYDPEMITAGDADFASKTGTDGQGYGYPMTRSVTIGLNINF